MLRTKFASFMPMGRATFDAEGAPGGGAGDVKPGGDAKPAADPLAKPDASSVLFPKEGEVKPAPAAGDPPKDGDKPAVDWKEFVADPAKSEAENATAKAEHDKTKPAEVKPAAADVVPEDGKYTLAMPEGVQVDQELLDAIGPTLAAKKMTTGEVQGLVGEFIKLQASRAADQNKTWGETISGWVDAAKSDKDIGGDKWDATVTTAHRAVNTLGTPALKEYFEATGGGNHPELIRFMAKVGAMIKEDSPAGGGDGGGSKPVDAAHILFANDIPKGN